MVAFSSLLNLTKQLQFFFNEINENSCSWSSGYFTPMLWSSGKPNNTRRSHNRFNLHPTCQSNPSLKLKLRLPSCSCKLSRIVAPITTVARANNAAAPNCSLDFHFSKFLFFFQHIIVSWHLSQGHSLRKRKSVKSFRVGTISAIILFDE